MVELVIPNVTAQLTHGRTCHSECHCTLYSINMVELVIPNVTAQ